MINLLKRCAIIFATASFCFFAAFESVAQTAWPAFETELTAEAAICMDADSGTVLYEKNGSVQEYPASITKVMTALVVLEHAELNEEVTFSHDAVYNVDIGSSNANIEEGDVLTVEDCLYALLFKSANEAANALAEHIAGSREDFAEMMNQKAEELGCTGTHFSNPSGLHAEDHYTTAYDMALIGQAAMDNKDFMKLESKLSHRLAPTVRNEKGVVVTLEHKMKNPDSEYFDDRVVAGKTGYTSISGNTLITMAESEGRRVVTVVLKDKNPQHYIDTKALLDFGFGNFENIKAEGALFDKKALEQRLLNDTVLTAQEDQGSNHLKLDREGLLTVPKGALPEEIAMSMDYNLGGNAPENAVARLTYKLGEHVVGIYDLLNSYESSISVLTEASTPVKVAVVSATVVATAGIAVAGFGLIGGGTFLHLRNCKKEREKLERLKIRRKQRLQEMSVSEEEFLELLEKRRQQSLKTEHNRRGGFGGRRNTPKKDNG